MSVSPFEPSGPSGSNKGLVRRASRELSSRQYQVYQHHLGQAAKEQMERRELAVLHGAMSEALDAELELLFEFRAKAGDSQAAMMLVAQKLKMFSDMNSRRIAARHREWF